MILMPYDLARRHVGYALATFKSDSVSPNLHLTPLGKLLKRFRWPIRVVVTWKLLLILLVFIKD